MKKIQKSMFLAAGISLMLSGCSIVEKQIVFDVNAAKGHTVFSINDTKCNIKEANIYLCNYRNLYGEEYGVDLWECSQQPSDLESYIKDVTIDELVRVYCLDKTVYRRLQRLQPRLDVCLMGNFPRFNH